MRSIIWVGEPWNAYLADKNIPEFIDVFVSVIPTVLFTTYVTAPVFGLLISRWINAPRSPYRYREPWRTIDEGFSCFVRKQRVPQSGKVA
jgi:hypothetical protein